MPKATGNGMKTLAAWPSAQIITPLDEPLIGLTQFADHAQYHAALKEKILELNRTDSPLKDALVRGACGTKIRDVDQWSCPEATFLHQRAIALFQHMLNTDDAVVDTSWASIYRKGDHCLPHSHVRAQASLVYMLDEGDVSENDPLSGKFLICDPRLDACCNRQKGCLTNLMIPTMTPGSMIIFPGSVVHCVSPYSGARPRITLSWNINTRKLSGAAQDYWKNVAPAS